MLRALVLAFVLLPSAIYAATECCSCKDRQGNPFSAVTAAGMGDCNITCSSSGGTYTGRRGVCPPPPAPPPPVQPPATAPGLVEIRGPKVAVRPCTSATCNECCYHNNGEAAIIVPADLVVQDTRNYISALETETQFSLCPVETDCQFAKFTNPLLRITNRPPKDWPGPALQPGQVFLIRPLKNWSHNRTRVVQLGVIYMPRAASLVSPTAKAKPKGTVKVTPKRRASPKQ
jgi:hypothetical protein